MILLAPKAVWIALLTPASAYQLHDPELLPWAWILLLRRVPVFYDIHEDYSLAMQKKSYLPRWSRRLAGRIVALLERIFSLPFHLIIAEYSYAKRFPRATPVLNYPLISLSESGSSFGIDPEPRDLVSPESDNAHLLYTGHVTVERGALNLAKVIRDLPDVEISLVGRCYPDVARLMRQTAAGGADRLHIIGEDRYVPFHEIKTYYFKELWTAGIVLIPDILHFKEKQLTKFFEFMSFGLPIIASDYPVWRKLISDQGVGICVNPEDSQEVKEAVDYLKSNPSVARKMGQRGRYLVRKEYHWKSQAKRLIELYYAHIM
jgi:glycosyltransferase involved in cell wall biosynthesis